MPELQTHWQFAKRKFLRLRESAAPAPDRMPTPLPDRLPTDTKPYTWGGVSLWLWRGTHLAAPGTLAQARHVHEHLCQELDQHPEKQGVMFVSPKVFAAWKPRAADLGRQGITVITTDTDPSEAATDWLRAFYVDHSDAV